MTTIDRTQATDAEFQARIQPFGIFEEEERLQQEAMPHTLPDECGECASWSRERKLPTDTLVRVLVTLEADR